MTDLAALVVRMQADNSAYVKALDQATSKLNKFSKDQHSLVSEIGDKFKEFATRFAEAFALEKIVEFSAGAIEGAASLEKFSQSAGVSVEELGSLQIAMAGSGVDVDGLSLAFKKLNVAASTAAGDGNSKAAIAFQLLGINVRDASGNIKDAATLNDEVADSFSKTADGANKVAIAVALYGKQGQEMIPTLNQGSVALKAQQQAAIDAGAVLSGPAAEAAEAAEKKFAQLAATTKGQLSVAIVSALTPALDDVATAFKGAANNSDLFRLAGDGIALVFRTVASIVAEIGREAETVIVTFKGVGAYAAAAVQLAKGNLSEAKAIIADFDAENAATQQKYADIQKRIWGEQTQAQIDAAKAGAKGAEDAAKPQTGNLEAAVKQNAADQALKKLSESLREQADAFGLGGAAAVRFKLTVGQLGEDMKIASDQGKAFAASAIAAAQALETKKDTKTVTDYTDGIIRQIAALDQGGLAAENYALHSGALGLALDGTGKKADAYRESIMKAKAILIDDQDQKAVQALADKADVLAGRLNKAALAAFDLQNQMLKKNLEASSSPDAAAGLAVLANERAHVDALSKIQELNLQAAQINSVIGDQEAKIELARSAGQITDIDAMNQIAALRAKQITDLNSVYQAEQGIAAAANDPSLTDGVRKFGVQIDALKVQMNQFDQQVRQGLEGAFAHNFSDLITGAKSFKQAILGFLQDIDKQFVDMIAKQYAQKLFAAGGADGSGGGALGGLAGMLGGLLGGGGGAATSIASTGAAAAGTDTGALADTIMPFAGGGTLGAGKVGLVGEAGPELVYSGSQNMNVIPSAGLGGKQVSVTNHFIIQAPGGTISRASQMQTAAAAARSLSQANRRNNT
jgi:hypothetical protein